MSMRDELRALGSLAEWRSQTVDAFAAELERQQRERLARDYPRLDLNTDTYRVRVRIGPKYTRVDFGSSGMYMVVNATGEIFGIKGYGVIHRGHPYGTLDTIGEWDWSPYKAVRRPEEIRCTSCADTGCELCLPGAGPNP